MKPKYFDIHSHINDERFNDDREEVIARMKAENLWTIVVGTDLESSCAAVALSQKYDNVYASVGLHPTDNTTENLNVDAYKKLAELPKTVAIGECGLDYEVGGEKTDEQKARQKKLFEAQIDLAVELDLPVMVHCRGAHDDALSILTSKKAEHGERLRGNIHFFSEGKDVAQKYFDLNFTISFTGVVTFTHDYDEAVKYAPKDMIMSETDCPYVAPVPHRGKRNEPLYVKEVVARLAEIRGEKEEDLAPVLVENASRVFGIDMS